MPRPVAPVAYPAEPEAPAVEVGKAEPLFVEAIPRAVAAEANPVVVFAVDSATVPAALAIATPVLEVVKLEPESPGKVPVDKPA